PVEDRGDRQNRAADRAAQPPADDSHQDGGFKGQVGGEKAADAEPDPYSERDRQRHPQRQIDFLACFAVLEEKELLEFLRPTEHGGHRRGNTQLDQQINENEPLFEHEVNRPLSTQQRRRLPQQLFDARPGGYSTLRKIAAAAAASADARQNLSQESAHVG